MSCCSISSSIRVVNKICRFISIQPKYSFVFNRMFHKIPATTKGGKMAEEVLTVAFSNGKSCPILGLGTWKSKPGEVTQAVMDAIDAGYRHIDTAYVYGNEKEVGLGIKAKIDDNTVKREDLFICTKLWNTFHRPDLVQPALETSLKNLGLSYVDLYLIHWPMGYKEGPDLFPQENGKTLYSTTSYLNTWKQMEKIVDKGLATSIGVSNFNSMQVEQVLAAGRIEPVVNQVECHPYLNQKKLEEHHNSRGVVLVAYSPLGSPDRPMAKPNEVPIMERPEIVKLAAKYNKSPAQILIRYQIDRGNVVIPKSVTKSRIESNIDVFNFDLSFEDIDLLNTYDCNMRLIALENIKDHKDYPFSAEF